MVIAGCILLFALSDSRREGKGFFVTSWMYELHSLGWPFSGLCPLLLLPDFYM